MKEEGRRRTRVRNVDNELRSRLATMLLICCCCCSFVFECNALKKDVEWNFFAGAGGYSTSENDWSSSGMNIHNTRNITDSLINSSTLDLSNPSFRVVINSSASANPAIFGNSIIVPSWDGRLRAMHRLTGAIHWDLDIGMTYFKVNVTGKKVSRTTPVIWQHYYIIIGTSYPAELLLIRIYDGSLLWNMTLDNHPYSVITGSGTIYNNHLYQPISSTEKESTVNITNYTCCSFVGSMVSVYLPGASIAWKTHTIGKNISGVEKFSGAAIWGSTPPINTELGLVYAATGNNYNVSTNYSACIETTPLPNVYNNCDHPYYIYNHPDSVLAFNIKTGKIVWVFDGRAHNAWNLACNSSNTVNPNCPISLPTVDDLLDGNYDFGMNPVLDKICVVMTTKPPSNCLPALYIAQKSGALFSLSPETGATYWANQTSPGGYLGGSQWGVSVDDYNVYMGVYNSEHLPWTLSNGTVINGGGWVAYDKHNGSLVWTTANPANFDPSGPPESGSSNGRSTYSYGAGPPLAVNDIVLVTSSDTVYTPDLGSGVPNGTIGVGGGGWDYVLNKTNGGIIQSFESGSGTINSFSGNKKCLYASNGYREEHFGMANGTTVFGWCILEETDNMGSNQVEEEEEQETSTS